MLGAELFARELLLNNTLTLRKEVAEMEADLETAVQFLLAAHDDDSQRATGRSSSLADRVLLRYTMGAMGAHALVLVHETDFIWGFIDLFIARAKLMRVNAYKHADDKIGIGTTTMVHVSTDASHYLGRIVRGDVFEDHFRFAGRLQRLFDNRNSFK